MMLSSAFMGPVVSRIGYRNGFLITGLVSLLVIGFFHFLMKNFSPHPGGPGMK
jgi:hypothetical protein